MSKAPKLVSPLNKYKLEGDVPIVGYRGGQNITPEDKLLNISSIANMMMGDLNKLNEACIVLCTQVKMKSQSGTNTFRKRINLIKAGILSLSKFSEDILNLTNKKTSTIYNACREKSFITYSMKMESQIAKQTKPFGMRKIIPNREASLFNDIKRIGDKRKIDSKKMRKSCRKADIQASQKKQKLDGDISFENGKYIFRLPQGRVVKLDPPKYENNMYTLRELVVSLHEISGKRSIIDRLHNNGLICFTRSSFSTHVNAFKTKKIMPKEGDFGGKSGRPPVVEFNKITEVLNTKHKQNIGFVEDDKDGTAHTLKHHLKESAKEMDIAPESITGIVSATTLQRYTSASISFDPSISSGFQHKNARKKNHAREQASRSKRNAAGMIGIAGASFMIPGTAKLPTDLPKGAKLFLDACTEAFGCVVKPKDKIYLLNFDEVGRWVWSGGESESKNHIKSKVSKDSMNRNTRGISSVWRSFNSNENTCNGLSCKFLVLVSAGGYLAPVCIHFHGLAETELSEDFITMEVPGLVPGGDMVCSNEFGYVIFTRRRSNKNTSEEDHYVTISERLMAWYHETIVVPFTVKLRERQTLSSWKPGMKVSISETFSYRLDSAMSYLKYLNRDEVVNDNKDRGISVVKIAAAATESWQENDVGKGMRCTASLIRSRNITRQNDAIHLKVFKSKFQELRDTDVILMGNRAKYDAVLEVIGKAPTVFQQGFNSQRIMESFAITGSISKGEISGQYHSFPNMTNMINQCKVSWGLEERKQFQSQAPSFIKFMTEYGYHSSEFLNGEHPDYADTYVDPDTNINGVVDYSRDNYSLLQLHLQRFVLIGHKCIRDVFLQAVEEESGKKKLLMKKMNDARDVIDKNEEAINILIKLKQMNRSDLDDEALIKCFSDCSLKDFAYHKLTKSHLRAFVLVRESEDIHEAMQMKVPSIKGSLRSIEEGNTDCLLMVAYQKRNLVQKAKGVQELSPNSGLDSSIPSPLIVRVDETLQFVPTIDWLSKASSAICSISRRCSVSGYNVEWFESTLLSDHLTFRLHKHLSCSHIPEGKGRVHWVWKWQLQNIKHVSAILKLAGLVLPDTYIRTRTVNSCLLSQNSVNIAEMINDTNGHEVGAYLYLFSPEGGVIQQWRRAGSASVGLKKRGIEHEKSSLQKSDQNRDSNFYRTFPHKDCERSKTADFEGCFQDLQHRVGLSYHKENLQNVINLFHWSKLTERSLEAKKHKNLTIDEKKHRLICYFFESALQLCLDPTQNVSRSVGNELFLGVIN